MEEGRALEGEDGGGDAAGGAGAEYDDAGAGGDEKDSGEVEEGARVGQLRLVGEGDWGGREQRREVVSCR